MSSKNRLPNPWHYRPGWIARMTYRPGVQAAGDSLPCLSPGAQMYLWVGPGQDEPLSTARVLRQYFVAVRAEDGMADFKPHLTVWVNSWARLQSQVGQRCRHPTGDAVGILAQP